MDFNAEVIKEVSFDPYFKIKFSYEADGIIIKRGIAEVTRKAPKPVIVFDAETELRIKHVDRSKLELELLNTVINHIFSNGVKRSWKGNIILNTA